MKLVSSCLVVLCACLMVVTLPLWGTQVQYMNVEQLGDDSAAMVRGTVAEVRYFTGIRSTSASPRWCKRGPVSDHLPDCGQG